MGMEKLKMKSKPICLLCINRKYDLCDLQEPWKDILTVPEPDTSSDESDES